MPRETKTVKLSNGTEVILKAWLSWGEKEDLKTELMKGAKFGASGMTGFDVTAIAEEKMKTMEAVVVKVIEGGAEKPFTREWVRALRIEDGDKLASAIEEIAGKKG